MATNIHSGSWLGLPDFSITENIGNLLGGYRTAQGGSNLSNSVGALPTAQVVQGGQTQTIQGPGLGWSGNNDVVKPTSAGVAPKPMPTQTSATQTSALPDWGRGQFEGQEVGSGGYIWKWNQNGGVWQQVRQDTSGKPASSGGSTGGGTTKLGNDQLDQIVNVNGVNKTRRSAIAENLMDEFGNLFPTPTYTGPSDQDLNSAYAPLFDVLSQAEKMLGTNYGTQKTNIEGQVATAKQLADEQKRVAGETIAQNDVLGAKRKEDVISSARKLYQELQNANQQRFGGASSAGQAASELQGREFMSLSGKAQQGYSDLVKELNTKKLEVDNNYTLALQQLEDKKAAALADAQNNFQNALLQITQQKAGLESEKMQRKLSALETYKNQVQAVQQQQAQFAQQLQAAKYQSDLQIENYAQQLAMSKQGANQSLQNYISDPTLSAVLSPTTQNQISNTYSGGFNQVNPELLKQLQGMVAGQTRRDDELYGGLTPGLSSIQSLAR